MNGKTIQDIFENKKNKTMLNSVVVFFYLAGPPSAVGSRTVIQWFAGFSPSPPKFFC